MWWVAVLAATLSLLLFLAGIGTVTLQLLPLLPAALLAASGSLGLFLVLLLRLTKPECFRLQRSFTHTKTKIYGDSFRSNDLPTTALITPDATEALMKSIRGIPYLIQAIQYSLETSYYTNMMTEMGQSVLGNSVIHTAPGCTSILDCHSADDNHISAPMQPPSPRYSGPEEQWTDERNRWFNQQLRLAMNRRTSAALVSVFPYSESRPIDEIEASAAVAAASSSGPVGVGVRTTSTSIAEEQESPQPRDESSLLAFNGSQQSQLSRVTVSHTNLPSREIRCIGMSSAFLTQFNSSFKSNSK